MTEREKQIIENFALIIPELSEENKKYLLGIGEGMVICTKMNKKAVDETKQHIA